MSDVYNLKGFVRTHVILAPGACGWVGLSCGIYVASAGCGGLPRAAPDELWDPTFLTTLPSISLKNAAHGRSKIDPELSLLTTLPSNLTNYRVLAYWRHRKALLIRAMDLLIRVMDLLIRVMDLIIRVMDLLIRVMDLLIRVMDLFIRVMD